ncbi:Gfo/Idh/MocA family protein [Vibrio nigripulchritudo]|uniref:Gfo/Idh/MocA family protein n=1 Tax=Vibrio nigripulchritudo TaxID=28173 RepID=UPI0005FA351D|nr:Gfo/Idh/MocA family oxidoreductase [Vibrio nigripulchritudo]KJY79859.1 oxidoreductase [Vibrio nigripulchritudo]
MEKRIRMGMVGGGKDALIGEAHRVAARIDGRYELCAGVLSSTPERSLESGKALGLEESRIYSDYKVMAEQESQREDGIDVVVVATPNHLHYDVSKAFIEQGIHVICDKPLTSTLNDAVAFHQLVQSSEVFFMLTHNYSGYPMIREAKRIVESGEIGNVRVIQMEYVQGWLAKDSENGKQAKWRLNPATSGKGGSIGDIGTHALQLAEFVTGKKAQSLSADLTSFGADRQLDDNAHILFKFEDEVKGMMWASQIAVGFDNGLQLRVMGEKGSLIFHQERPNELQVTLIDQPTQKRVKGGAGFEGFARIPAGHPEGYLEAFSRLYSDFADWFLGSSAQKPDIPGVDEGVRGLCFIEAAVESSNEDGAWKTLEKFISN